MSICRICLASTNDASTNDASTDDASVYHSQCLRSLFGVTRLPRIDVELAQMHTAALAMVGRTSLSGIQKKISVGLTSDRKTLQVAVERGRYILKPRTEAYPELPENEHVTTQLARLVDLETASNGLVLLKGGSLAFVSARFDRRSDGTKRRQEDFCQLAGKSPKEKYDGSSELCIKLIRQFASEPLVEIHKFFRQLVFAWWTGNGDMHLKNFSLQATDDGYQRLTPAYDQVCTRLVIRDDPLALSVCGKKDRLNRPTWMKFAQYCGIPERAAKRVLDQQASVSEPAIEVISRCFLSANMKEQYKQLLQARATALRD